MLTIDPWKTKNGGQIIFTALLISPTNAVGIAGDRCLPCLQDVFEFIAHPISTGGNSPYRRRHCENLCR